MTDLGLIAGISIFTAGLTVSFGAIGPALGEGRAASTALSAIAQQPDAASRSRQRKTRCGVRVSVPCACGVDGKSTRSPPGDVEVRAVPRSWPRSG